MPESKLTVESMTEQIAAVLDNPDGAMQMAISALKVGRPEAAEALANVVETLAEERYLQKEQRQ